MAVATVARPPPEVIEKEGAGEPASLQQRGERAEIRGDARLHIGVGAGGGEAFVFAHLRADLGRKRHRHARHQGRQHRARPQLMRGIAVAVEEPDGDALDAVAPERRRERQERRLVERDADGALRVHPFRHGEAEVAGHQRRRPVHEDVVLRRTGSRSAISTLSRNPAVVISAVRTPLRSMMALVASVVPWTMMPISPGSCPVRPSRS